MIELIFSQVSLKLHLNLINITGEFLSFDQLKKEVKIYLLTSVLEEIKKFLINDLYYKSKNENLNFKANKFFELILLRVKKKIENDFGFLYGGEISTLELNWVVKYLEIEDGELFYLILSLFSSSDSSKLFSINGFDKFKLIISLVESLVIKLSSVFIYVIFLKFNLRQLVHTGFFYPNADFLKIQKNNFYWQAYLISTFIKPKYIYYNLYNLRILNKYGIMSKLIYFPILTHKSDYQFSIIQLFVLFYFELIDFIYPKLSRLFQSSKKAFNLLSMSM
jgi:hypothetical protein